jgi:hypothetical protein
VVLFAGALAVYLAAGAVQVFGLHRMEGDALSRVANAYYVLFSRDPHLAAVGFIWNPLPSLLTLPLLPLHRLWPALVEEGFAGNIESALFMAGCVVQVRAMLRDLGVRHRAALLLTALFALHPMILLFGGNGMSEAPFMFFVLVAVRHLAGWARGGAVTALIGAGLGLAGAYLTRYEAVPVGMAAVTVAVLLTWRRCAGTRRHPAWSALVDGVVLGAPLALVVALRAGASWLIIGHPFQQFSSVYGNTAQLSVSGPGRGTPTGSLLQAATLEPGLALLLLGAAVVAVRRRELRALALLLPVAALAFTLAEDNRGVLLPWLRFLILVVPLATLAVGLLLAAPRRRRLVAAVPVLLLALGLPSSVLALRSGTGVAEETHTFQLERSVAGRVDALPAGRGEILVDAFMGFPIVLASRHPERLVVTSDRDFRSVLADPAGSGVRWLLVPRPDGVSGLDALSQTYPGIWRDGAGLGRLEREFGGGAWRLYRVTASPG